MPQAGVPLEVFLAVLNTSVTEMAVRVSAHVYGGGVYNLSPGSVGEVPVIDVRQLPPEIISQLHNAYRQFLRSNGTDRSALDAAAMAALGLPDTFAETLRTALGRMQHLSDAILEPIAVEAAEGSTWPEDLRLL
jgi:hypothetical protein